MEFQRDIRHSVAAWYEPERFRVVLSNETPLFENIEHPILRSQPSQNYSVFTHEYWHYLLNMSTVSRLRDYLLSHERQVVFSTLLKRDGSGECLPKTALDERNKMKLNSLERMRKAFQGDDDYSLEIDPEKIKTIEVTGYNIQYIELPLDGGIFSHGPLITPVKHVPQAMVKAECETHGGIVIPISFILGNYVIEESIAYEVDRFVDIDSPEDNAPQFPYLILRALVKHIFPNGLSRYESISLATLSLLSTDSGISLINILNDYHIIKQSQMSTEESLATLWINRGKFFQEADLDDLISSLDSNVVRYTGRGSAENAIRYLRDESVSLLKRRMINPFFDLEPFKGEKVDTEALIEFQKKVAPCPIIQEFNGPDDQLGRDILAHFDDSPFDNDPKIQPPALSLTVLNCQQHYAAAHLDGVSERCPYYTSCTHENRKTSGMFCDQRPWFHFRREKIEGLCYYEAGIQGVYGKSELRLDLIKTPTES